MISVSSASVVGMINVLMKSIIVIRMVVFFILYFILIIVNPSLTM